VRLLRLGPYIVGALTSAALLAGCSAGGSQSSALGSTALNPALRGTHAHRPSSLADMHLTVYPYKTGHRDHRKTWVSPDVLRNPRLLFISDPGAGNVDIFTMPALALKGQITGLSVPQGMCSDSRTGFVWVADTGALTMQEYDRNGTLLNTLDDPAGFPGSCAVDPTTGNLAVTDIVDFTGNGTVLIYAGSTGPPSQQLRNPDMLLASFAGYDGGGNLYVDGFDTFGNFILSESTPGSGALSTLTVTGGALFWPGMVQWNIVAGDLVVGDQTCNNTPTTCLYSMAVSGPNASITGVTNLQDSSGNPICDMAEGVVGRLGKMSAAGSSYNACTGDPNSVDRWHFPAGGLPTNSTTGIVDPAGAALSNK
jgi:hypothetical protein